MACPVNPSRPPRPSRSATERIFERIDTDARAICPENDESKQYYAGLVWEIERTLEAAMRRADEVDRRLEHLRQSRTTPQWEVTRFARAGSVYDCLWNSLRSSTPIFLDPRQIALFTRLQRIATRLAAAGSPGAAAQFTAQMQSTQQQWKDQWSTTRDSYLAVLVEKTIRAYVTAAVLARRYALGGFTFTRAAERLPVVSSLLGEETMSRIVRSMVDPTDPARDRTLTYVRDYWKR